MRGNDECRRRSFLEVARVHRRLRIRGDLVDQTRLILRLEAVTQRRLQCSKPSFPREGQINLARDDASAFVESTDVLFAQCFPRRQALARHADPTPLGACVAERAADQLKRFSVGFIESETNVLDKVKNGVGLVVDATLIDRAPVVVVQCLRMSSAVMSSIYRFTTGSNSRNSTLHRFCAPRDRSRSILCGNASVSSIASIRSLRNGVENAFVRLAKPILARSRSRRRSLRLGEAREVLVGQHLVADFLQAEDQRIALLSRQ